MIQEVPLPPKVHLLYGPCCIGRSELACFAAQVKDDGYASAHAEVTLGEPDKVMLEQPRGSRRGLINIMSMASIRAKVVEHRLCYLLRRAHPWDRPVWPQPDVNVHAHLCLENALTTCFAFETTEQHDRIYSLMGLVEGPAGAVPTPDYRLAFPDVYIRTARLLLTRGGQPKMSLCLACIGIYRSMDIISPEAIPSWLPDYFTSIESLSSVPRHWGHPGQPSLTIRDDGRCVVVQAQPCYSIQALGPCLRAEAGNDSFNDVASGKQPDTLLNWFYEATQFAKVAYATFHERPGVDEDDDDDDDDGYKEGFWRALLTDTYGDEYPISPSTYRHLLRQSGLWAQLRREKLGETNSLEELLANGSAPDKYGLTHTLTQVLLCGGKRLAFANSGHFMLVPPLTKEGDIVGFIRNDDWPYLFRPTAPPSSTSRLDDGDHRVYFVGTAFMEGVFYPGDDEDLYQELVLVQPHSSAQIHITVPYHPVLLHTDLRLPT